MNDTFNYIKNMKYFILLTFIINFISSQIISNIYSSNQLCSLSTYDNRSITKECINGPKKETRILEYRTFDEYISSHSYKHNGLNFYTSLYVDTDYHNFWDFMDGGTIIIILFIIVIIFLIAWIPLICCWKYSCCLYDECCTDKKNLIIFWHIITYTLFGAILSFIIICIIFSE